MRHLLKTLRLAAFVTLLATIASHAQSPNPAPPADHPPRLCGSINYVGAQTANPFTGKHTTKTHTILPDGTQKTTELVELAARDSDGRIRFEKHGVYRPAGDEKTIVLHTRDGGTIETTPEILGVQILIFDCPAGTAIQIQPGLQFAKVNKGAVVAQPNRPLRPYSIRVTNLLSGKPQPNISVEDLGYREIEGITARGVRLTDLGTESDGDWNGKPVRITETWASDDLAATILEIHKDLRKQMEDTMTLTDIKRQEPDHSLFEIPQGYKINPTPDEMPFQTNAGIPVTK